MPSQVDIGTIMVRFSQLRIVLRDVFLPWLAIREARRVARKFRYQRDMVRLMEKKLWKALLEAKVPTGPLRDRTPLRAYRVKLNGVSRLAGRAGLDPEILPPFLEV